MPAIHRFSVILLTAITLLAGCTNLQAKPGPTAETQLHQTGVTKLDKIITVVLEGDAKELRRSLIEFTSTTCTFAEGLGGPPRCLDGEQEGTPVEVLPFLGPEGHFIRKEAIESWQGLQVSRLFAVYQVSGSVYSDKNYPAGEYAIVFIGSKEEKTSVTLQVTQEKIVRIDYGFGYPPVIRQEDVARFLVAPGNVGP